jgi:hypothetical protein
MANTPASKTNVARRFAERGEGGEAIVSLGSGPSLIELQTMVCGSNSNCRRANTAILANFLPNRDYNSVMVTGGHWTRLAALFSARTPRVVFGVRVRLA